MRAALLALWATSLCIGLAGCVDVPDPVDARSDGPMLPSDRGMTPDALSDGAPPVDAIAEMDGHRSDGPIPDASMDAMVGDAMPIDAIVDATPPIDDAEPDMAPPLHCAPGDLHAAEVGLCVRFEALDDLPQPVLDPASVALDDGSLLVINQLHIHRLQDVPPVEVRPSTYLLAADADAWRSIDGPDPRTAATLTHVPGGETLYAGGDPDTDDIGTRVQRWQADARLWASDEGAVQHRYQHAAVAFRGHVVLIGGQDEGGALGSVHTLSDQIEDAAVNNLPDPRHGHFAVAAADGILAFGGEVAGQPTGSSIRWSAQAGWQPTLGAALPVLGDGAGIASDGATVLLGGGDDGADGATDALFVWREAAGWIADDPLTHDRKRHTITALDDDLFLVVGSHPTIELLRTDTGQRSAIEPPLDFGAQRRRHSAVTPGPRTAVILGGRIGDDVQDSAWRVSVYDAEAPVLGPQQ